MKELFTIIIFTKRKVIANMKKQWLLNHVLHIWAFLVSIILIFVLIAQIVGNNSSNAYASEMNNQLCEATQNLDNMYANIDTNQNTLCELNTSNIESLNSNLKNAIDNSNVNLSTDITNYNMNISELNTPLINTLGSETANSTEADSDIQTQLNTINGRLKDYQIKRVSQAEYNALTKKDAKTLYICY